LKQPGGTDGKKARMEGRKEERQQRRIRQKFDDVDSFAHTARKKEMERAMTIIRLDTREKTYFSSRAQVDRSAWEKWILERSLAAK
jgi:hypothetical protein